MNIIVITTTDRLGGPFGLSYKRSKGPPIGSIVLLPERGDLTFPVWARIPAGLRLCGPMGFLRLAAASYSRTAITAADRDCGLHHSWPDAICHRGTSIFRITSWKDEGARLLRDLHPDLLVSLGAPVIIGNKILDLPRIGAINVHHGRLPKYRGHFGTFWEVRNLEQWGYTCVHEMGSKVDAGRLLGCGKVRMGQFRSILDIVIAKKIVGGNLLANLLKTIGSENSLPVQGSFEIGQEMESSYYPWPSVCEVLRFCFPRGEAYKSEE